MNTAADFLSRLDLDPKEKIQLLIKDDIQTSPIEVHILSSNVAEEEQIYFFPEDDIETEEQIWERKQRARKKMLINDTPLTPGEKINNTTTHPEETTVIFQTEITRRTQNTEENERPLPCDMRHQQDQDNVLRNYNLRLLKEPYDEHLMATNHRALQYTAQESRIILKDGLLYRQYFGDRSSQIPAGLTTRTISRLIHRSPPRIARQTSWDNQSDRTVQRKILLPRLCSKNSQTHQPMHEMHANEANG